MTNFSFLKVDSYKNIEQKIHQFVIKYYTNELIKGGILFFALGFLYFFFTVFIEYFLWLNPFARTLLFWLFIAVEIGLLYKFIVLPIFKLTGFKKGISLAESSKIIGNHFPEVADKLTNILQLKTSSNQSDLLLASIAQKSKELTPIPFVKAISFKTNKSYLKYAAIPIFLFLFLWLSGKISFFKSSFERVVHYQTAYIPPAPFAFQLSNKNLHVIEEKPITIRLNTVGKVVPEDVKIVYNNQRYFLQKNDLNSFTYTFTNTINPINFYVEANGIRSENYQIKIIKTPTIQQLKINLKYPNYTGKKSDEINNTGNILIPEGTRVRWQVSTKQTDSVFFKSADTKQFFRRIQPTNFSLEKRILKNTNYEISTSNRALKNYEKMQFTISVIKDEFPKIEVFSDVDSTTTNTAHFAGKISDDYGLKKLQMVYYETDNPSKKISVNRPIQSKQENTFYDQFPGKLSLKKGVNYTVYFQVFDNDAVHGSKKTKSVEFTFRNKTDREIEQETLQSQRNRINNIESTLKKQQGQNTNLENIKQNLENKKNLNWNDKKKLTNFIERQEQYKQMMQRQTDKLQQNLENKPSESKTTQEKKAELQKRIAELKKLEKEQKLLDELKKVSDKLNKEDLLRKLKKLSEQNKQQERSLERILELTKRFYVEQKTMQLANKLNELSKKQDSLKQQPKENLNQQQKIKKEFQAIKKELNQLQKDNKALKEPMKIPDTKQEQQETEQQLNQAQDSNKKSENRKKSQGKAAQKMQQMSQKMQQSMMDLQGEMQEANKKTLQMILKNLLTFSFQQEDLMNSFSKIDVTHPNFGVDLKKQYALKTYFEHVDDSLYVLSMRLPEISVIIQKELTEAHYNLDQSLDNFAQNRFSNALSNQQYVMTATNNLADFLSNILDKMQEPKSSKSGKGKKGGKQFSLPDIIKKQGELQKKVQQENKEGKEKKEKKGGKKNSEDLDGKLFKIYQQQTKLRQAFQEALKKSKDPNNTAAKKIVKAMQQLENELLEKGFQKNTLNQMQQLQYNLLKLDKATFEQGFDTQRKSKANLKDYQNNNSKLFIKKLFYNQTEILNRQSLPLQKNYKKKVQAYFKSTENKQSND